MYLVYILTFIRLNNTVIKRQIIHAIYKTSSPCFMWDPIFLQYFCFKIKL